IVVDSVNKYSFRAILADRAPHYRTREAKSETPRDRNEPSSATTERRKGAKNRGIGAVSAAGTSKSFSVCCSWRCRLHSVQRRLRGVSELHVESLATSLRVSPLHADRQATPSSTHAARRAPRAWSLDDAQRMA